MAILPLVIASTQVSERRFDRSSWTRLLSSCVNFYKEVLLLENYAIMNYCGFSKILKKHDKLTGYTTREAYLKNVVNQQKFTHFPFVLELLKSMEKLFEAMHSAVPIEAEEKLFIDAIRGLNYQAERLQAQELFNSEVAVDNAKVEGPMEHFKKACEKLTVEKQVADDGAHIGDNDLSINSSLFPRLSSSGRSSDSLICSEDEFSMEGKRRNTDVSSASDGAPISVLEAAGRVKYFTESSNLKRTMDWMNAIKSKISNSDRECKLEQDAATPTGSDCNL